MQLPPIHPAIVHFPIALIIVAFFADLIARITGRQSFRNFGFWSQLVAGFLLNALGLRHQKIISFPGLHRVRIRWKRENRLRFDTPSP